MSPFYITTAIDYINGAPHLGHAYEKIGTDVAARYKRMKGVDTFFTTGTDEHSLNVLKCAEEQGLSPLEYCDRMVEEFKHLCEVLRISYDRFIRTTDKDHEETVKAIVQKAWDNGYVYEGTYAGYYCESCEAFLDQDALVDGKCPYHPTREVKWVEENNYFFALSKFQERLLKHIQENPDFIQPETRRNEVVNRIREGLKDVSISRSSTEWGVQFPMNPNHVVYVWFDALINYVTAAGYPHDPERFAKYWPADFHIIGKDITWFHCVIWPCALMAVGLPVPKTVFAHGFVTLKGQRLSKSAGVRVDPIKLVEIFGVDTVRYFLMKAIAWGQDGDFSYETMVTTYNNDLANDFGNLLSRTTAMINKYFGGVIPGLGDVEPLDQEIETLARETLRSYDAAMEELMYSDAIGAVLALINRANKYIEETAPWELAKDESKHSRLGTVLYTLAEVLRIAAVTMTPFMPEAPKRIWDQLGLSGTPEQQGASLEWGQLAAGTRVNRGQPLFPRLDLDEVLERVEGRAGADSTAGSGQSDAGVQQGADAQQSAGAQQGAGAQQSVAAQQSAVAQKGAGAQQDAGGSAKPSSAEGTAGPTGGQTGGQAGGQTGGQAGGQTGGQAGGQTGGQTDAGVEQGELTIDEFAKVQLRTGKVIEASAHPKADRLLVLKVDIGSEIRQIVAGIAKFYNPQDLVGKTIVIVANLKPAKLRGVESQGMLLAASTDDDSVLRLVTVDGDIAPGSAIH